MTAIPPTRFPDCGHQKPWPDHPASASMHAVHHHYARKGFTNEKNAEAITMASPDRNPAAGFDS
jgi:hypothetical protein